MTVRDTLPTTVLPATNATVDTGFGVQVRSFAVGNPPAGTLSIDAVWQYAPLAAFDTPLRNDAKRYFAETQSDLFADQAQEATRRAQEQERLEAYWQRAAQVAEDLGARPNRSRGRDSSEEPPVLYQY